MVTNLESLINSDCAKTKLGLSSRNNNKKREKMTYALFFILIGTLLKFIGQSSKGYR